MTGWRTIVAGAGIFGVTAAIALRRRGRDVALVDPGPLPHPLAASTDISKVVRLDYGPDEDDTMSMERALDAWRRWNEAWPEPLFHETGVVFLRRSPMTPGSFEHESFSLLSRRGHRLERLDAGEIARRFPAWKDGGFVDGYFNPSGGYAESGRVVARLVEEARAAGVTLIEGAWFERLLERSSRVTGIVVSASPRLADPETPAGERGQGLGNAHREGRTSSTEADPDFLEMIGSATSPGTSDVSNLAFERGTPRRARTPDETRLEAGEVVLCLGAWTPHALPGLGGALRSNGLPVFHLRPDDADLFRADRFPVFCADITATGYYGFPVNRDGIVKVASHGPGRSMHPESPDRAVSETETAELRAFLAGALPELASAPIAHTRLCLYCDTWDGRFWIARDPGREGLTVAAGDSGHAFKFAPLLGDWIADICENRADRRLEKLRWRPEARPPRSEEAARRQDDHRQG